MMKSFYEAPQSQEVVLEMEGSILENSIFVTLALIDSTPGTDTRDMNVVDSQDW